MSRLIIEFYISMSRFRILVEELLEGFYSELGEMVLDERLVSFNSPVAKLVNKLEEELASEGKPRLRVYNRIVNHDQEFNNQEEED